MFSDRSEAGRRLARALATYEGQRVVVLALPRGGVPVAREIAHVLKAPLDLVMVRKIGVPVQPELAMGAVVDGPSPVIVRNADVVRAARVTEEEFAAVCDRELAEIRRRRRVYLGDRPHPEIDGRVAIVVDDGIATGATVRAALRSTRARDPLKLVLAVPVASARALDELAGEADEIVCLEADDAFGSISQFYLDFSPTSDAEVKAILAEFPVPQSENSTGFSGLRSTENEKISGRE